MLKNVFFLSSATNFLQEAAMLAAPFAAINFENLKDLKKTFQSFSDKIYYGEVLPPVGSLSLSYSKFLDLLEARQVKRITILADGKVALVEVNSCSRLPKRQKPAHSVIARRDFLRPR